MIFINRQFLLDTILGHKPQRAHPALVFHSVIYSNVPGSSFFSVQYIQVLELLAEVLKSKIEFLPLEISVSLEKCDM